MDTGTLGLWAPEVICGGFASWFTIDTPAGPAAWAFRGYASKLHTRVGPTRAIAPAGKPARFAAAQPTERTPYAAAVALGANGESPASSPRG